MRTGINNKHVIQQFSLNVASAGVDDPYTWQEEIALFCKTQLVPTTEALLEELVPGNIFLQLDQLEIDLEELESANWESALIQKFKIKIAESIKQLLSIENLDTKTKPIYEDAFIHFLIFGNLPWWMSANDFEEGFSSIDIQPQRLKEVFVRNPKIVNRLFSQYPETFLMEVIEKVYGSNFKKVKKIIESLITLSTSAGLNKDYIRPMLLKNSLEKALEAGVSNSEFLDALFQIAIPLLLDDRLRKAGKSEYKTSEINILRSEIGVPFDDAKISSPMHQIFLLLETPRILSFKSFTKNNADLADAIDRSVWAKKWCSDHRKQIRERISYRPIKKIKAKTKIPDPNSGQTSIEQRAGKSKMTKGIPKDGIGRQKGEIHPGLENKKKSTKNSKPSDKWNAEIGSNQLVEDKLAKQIQDFDIRQTEKVFEIIKQQSEADKKENKDFETYVNENDCLYIEYAGIVILHPFLSILFDTLKLLKDKQFVNEAAQEKAIHLLYYMASGQEQASEYHLSLCKLLCGYDILKPVDRYVLLDEFEKMECNKLLETVITHWTILKNTSIGALQEGFFQREGKLWIEEHNWKLKVEEKTIDILLQYLPWGLSIVKLPWMKQVIYVDWP